MAGDGKISMPGSFGGLMRYDEEYKSKFLISPMQAIAFVVIIILSVIGLKIMWPIGG
ncbi:preprotein translocase subunit Sec61beta [Candidatus Pacearchaeota archaeon]|nr:preprotein translocase subunit Sec61beta [Candidatus Pacearchaeota archaeon]